MGIGRIISNAGKYILNRGFGMMTQRQKTASALKVGRALFDATQKGQQFTPEVITSIFSSKLPKGVKLPPVFTTLESYKEYILSSPIVKILKFFKKETYKKIDDVLTMQLASAGALYKPLRNRSCFYLPQKYLTSSEASVVGMTHEFMHFLDLGKFPMPVKSLFAAKFQTQYMNIQQRCISELGLQAGFTGNAPEKFLKTITSSNKKITSYFRKILRQEMGSIPRPLRKMFLGFLERMNTSEVQAYTNSGKVARRFGILGQDRVHTSELIGKYQELFLEAIKAEKKAMKYARKTGVKIPKVPKKKFRLQYECIMDKSGVWHGGRKKRFPVISREYKLPKCVENIRKAMKTEGKNLYKTPFDNTNVVKSAPQNENIVIKQVSSTDCKSPKKADRIKIEFIKLND